MISLYLQLRKEKRELEETLESEQLSQVQHLQRKILKLESEVVRKQEALLEVRIGRVKREHDTLDIAKFP